MANLQLRNVEKSYGSVNVMRDVNLDIDDGEFVVFVGPSGCGKSTLLRMIAGLDEISGGTIEIGGRQVNEIAPSKRGVAMVFQTYALYPHMTVAENMAFGLKQAKTPQAEIDRRVAEAAETLQLKDYLDRQPKNLSGGQRQRVAIGRAIVRDPQVFLFDEPLSNLDAALRVQTRIEIARLHSRLETTMIYVTHDQVEAMTLADKIVVLNGGIIEQVGTPMTLYHKPQNMFVAGFIGSPKMNFFKARATNNKLDFGNGKSIDAQFDIPDGDVSVGMRPENIRITDESNSLISARLELVENLGEYALAYLTTQDGVSITAKVEQAPEEKPGQQLHLTCDAALLHVFDAVTEQRI